MCGYVRNTPEVIIVNQVKKNITTCCDRASQVKKEYSCYDEKSRSMCVRQHESGIYDVKIINEKLMRVNMCAAI